ncbi:uncharacterized protein LOC123536853 isoform X2 [Mercenaria mercenaria]|uniref:uncharacterized protein LOC123536853 isoform X2 n=1 Tax=Mercenaria mercenaria TaxID=6596 RepID=UPI00234E4C77|nr:uncharacterized protein LOC123536853 isoform X2 [Mercenaria mercenaria]
MSKQNNESILREIKARQTCINNVQHVLEISKEEQLLQQEKNDLKNSFFCQEKRQLYLEYLGKERDTWQDVKQTDERLKASREERIKVKNKLEEEKDKVFDILQKVSDEHSLLQEKINKAEEKLKIFEDKKKLFESRRKLDPTVADSAITKCKQAIVKIEAEVIKQQEELEKREKEIARLKSELGGKRIDRNRGSDEQTVTRLKKVLNFLESVNGLKVHVSGQEQLTLVFNKSSSELASVTSPEESLHLKMTLTFSTSCQGDARLSDVKISLDHFRISDIVDTAIAMNDVPFLVLSVQDRWNQHFPLLSEMDILNKNHAIDWIQEQCRLRVLVGKCGKIMFTLSVPKDYPSTRGISLLDSYGIDSVDTENLPDKDSTLLQWVLHLEETYGNC